MKLIEPQAIRLLSSTVPENDAPAWNAGTAYEIGDSVIHEHRVYKAVTASTGKRPDQNCEGTDAAWRLMGPTNRYAMLDQYVSTQTVAPMGAETLTFTVTFNRCTAFALLNFKATSIRAVVKDGDGLVMYDRTVNTLKDVDGYWKYYFLPLERIVDQAVTNIPMSPVATLEVTLTQEGGPALGQVIAGQAWPIGTTQYNTARHPGLFQKRHRRVRQHAAGQAGQRQAHEPAAVFAPVPAGQRAGNPRPDARPSRLVARGRQRGHRLLPVADCLGLA